MLRRSAFALFLSALMTVTALGGPAAAAGPHSFTFDGRDCELIPTAPMARFHEEALPFGIGPCPGVRPGAFVGSDGGGCTFNFLFQGADGHRYMGTAGHCILGDSPFGEDAGEQTWAPGTGPVATDGSGRRVGEFAYAILQDPKDFALVRLDPTVEASPQMCHFGGPTGLNTATSGSSMLHHRGEGILLGDAVPARSAFTTSFSNPDMVFAHGAAIFGDSGSGVIAADGSAVGVLVAIGVSGGGEIFITRLGPQVMRASEVLGTQLSLVTAPLL